MLLEMTSPWSLKFWCILDHIALTLERVSLITTANGLGAISRDVALLSTRPYWSSYQTFWRDRKKAGKAQFHPVTVEEQCYTSESLREGTRRCLTY